MLDCSSVDTATYSLAGLLGLSPAEVRSQVASIDVDWDHHQTSPEDQILIQFGVNPNTPPVPSAVRWFHATRAFPGTTFEDGLQPTLAALPKIWDVLGRCAAEWLTKQEWIDYQDSFSRGDRGFSGQFRRKHMAPDWEGPFAFLVRDAALRKHDGHKDFTRLCETMEDICADFEAVHGHPLRQACEKLSRPCLVVFTWPGAWPGTVRAAANYVFRSLRGIECGLHCNTNFSGKGKPVPRSLIDFVEWL